MQTIRDHVHLFFAAARVSFSEIAAQYTISLYLLTVLPRYVLQTTFFVLLARFVGGPDLMRFALVGNVIQVAANLGLVAQSSTIQSEKWQGTMPFLIASPSGRQVAILGRGVAQAFLALCSILLAFIFLLIIFPMEIAFGQMLLALPVILLIIFSTTFLGLAIGTLTLPFRSSVLIANIMAYSMLVLCGINFPIDVLPDVFQVLVRFLPVTNGLLAVRLLLDGAVYADVTSLLFYEFLVGVAYGIIGILIFEMRLRILTSKGKLELF